MGGVVVVGAQTDRAAGGADPIAAAPGGGLDRGRRGGVVHEGLHGGPAAPVGAVGGAHAVPVGARAAGEGDGVARVRAGEFARILEGRGEGGVLRELDLVFRLRVALRVAVGPGDGVAGVFVRRGDRGHAGRGVRAAHVEELVDAAGLGALGVAGPEFGGDEEVALAGAVREVGAREVGPEAAAGILAVEDVGVREREGEVGGGGEGGVAEDEIGASGVGGVGEVASLGRPDREVGDAVSAQVGAVEGRAEALGDRDAEDPRVRRARGDRGRERGGAVEDVDLADRRFEAVAGADDHVVVAGRGVDVGAGDGETELVVRRAAGDRRFEEARLGADVEDEVAAPVRARRPAQHVDLARGGGGALRADDEILLRVAAHVGEGHGEAEPVARGGAVDALDRVEAERARGVEGGADALAVDEEDRALARGVVRRADREIDETVAVRVADGEGDPARVGGAEVRARDVRDDEVDDGEVVGLVEMQVARVEDRVGGVHHRVAAKDDVDLAGRRVARGAEHEVGPPVAVHVAGGEGEAEAAPGVAAEDTAALGVGVQRGDVEVFVAAVARRVDRPLLVEDDALAVEEAARVDGLAERGGEEEVGDPVSGEVGDDHPAPAEAVPGQGEVRRVGRGLVHVRLLVGGPLRRDVPVGGGGRGGAEGREGEGEDERCGATWHAVDPSRIKEMMAGDDGHDAS